MEIAERPARPAERRAGKRKARRRATRTARALDELLALGILALALLAILLYLALLPPTRFAYRFNLPTSPVLVRLSNQISRAEILAFSIDRRPQVRLEEFYGLERNDLYAFHWAEPTAALTIPVNAPGDYRVTLTMLGNTVPGPPRAATLRVNDGPSQPIELAAELRDYAIEARVPLEAWRDGGQPTLEVAIAVDPLVPPGDRRPLGALVAGVAVTPVGSPAPWQPALFLPNLLLLLATYGLARAAGLRAARAAGLCAALLVAFGLLAVLAPAAAIIVAYRPFFYPLLLLGFGLLHVGALVFARLVVGPVPVAAGGAGAGRARAVNPLAGMAAAAGRAGDWLRATPGRLAGWSRPALAGGLGLAIVLLGTLRVVLGLFATLVVAFGAPARSCTWRGEEPMAPTGLTHLLLGGWQRADACWYEKVAALGYRPGDASVVFFPLYPSLIRLASLPLVGTAMSLGARLVLSGMIVSSVAYLIAMSGVYQLVRRDFSDPIARRTILALTLFPTGFFFFAAYTESVFLACVVWTLVFARRGQFWAAGAVALLASLTKTQGCLLALPIAWELFAQWRAQPPPRRAPGPERLAPLLPLYGLFGFLAYSRTFTGWTAFEAQSKQWGQDVLAPWTLLSRSLAYIARERNPAEVVNLALLTLCIALFLAGMRRLPLAYSLYIVPHFLLIITRFSYAMPLMSVSRYMLVLFPVGVVLALLGRDRRVWYPWLAVSALAQAGVFYAFLTRDFFS